MIDILGKRSSILKFTRVELTESNEFIPNPGKGWYRLYSFCLEDAIEEEALKVVICREEQLAMVQIDLGHYRDIPIDDDALTHLRQLLEFFQKEEKELILRFVYDKEGKGLEHEPSGVNLIQTHMKQVGVIVKEYSDIILTLQGLFIGSWGEMHNSKFLTPKHIRTLTQTLQEATGGSCRLAVRRPQYLRMLLNESQILQDDSKMNIGLYNDGMLATQSDLGTYGISTRNQSSWEDAWCREDELDFQDRIGQVVPSGGEVVEDNPLNNLEQAVTAMQKMHITYLHSLYDMRVLDKWKGSIYNKPGAFFGVSGYDYIGAHLGYRFVVRDVFLEVDKKKQTLVIKIENTGFANAYDEMQISLLLKEDTKVLKEISISTDVRKWRSKEITSISAELEIIGDIQAQVWLQMRRRKDNKSIQFANVGVGEALLLGKLLMARRPR